MGNAVDKDNRHTLTLYSKESALSQAPSTATNAIAPAQFDVHSSSGNYGKMPMIRRAVSTPTQAMLSEHPRITLETDDHTANAPQQQLLTEVDLFSMPAAVDAVAVSTPKSHKRKHSKKVSTGKNGLFAFKSKQTKQPSLKGNHYGAASTVPYTHFTDSSQTIGTQQRQRQRQQQSQQQRKSVRSATPNRTKFASSKNKNKTNMRRKTAEFLRQAFSSNDDNSCSSNEVVAVDDASYHSDPNSYQNKRQNNNNNIGHVQKQKPKHTRTQTTQMPSSTHALYNQHRLHGELRVRRMHSAAELGLTSFDTSGGGGSDDVDSDGHKQRNRRKILLLGNGSAGKSTIFKQFKLLLNGYAHFGQNELMEATHAIRQNLVSTLLLVMSKASQLHALNSEYFADCFIDLGDDAVRDAYNTVLKYSGESFEKIKENLTELSSAVAFLWSLQGVQSTVRYRHKRFTIPDNMAYFYDQIEHVFDAHYVPNTADIIRLRIRTTGMIDGRMQIYGDDAEEYNLTLFDTGGERNERKKWIHSFDNVDVVIFVAALSHFCSVLWEDEKTLSMHDAIELFQEICNGKWFKRSEIILILNKTDIFRQRLYHEISLKCGFADVRREDYNVHTRHPDEITPPPSPFTAGVNFSFTDSNSLNGDLNDVDGDAVRKENGDGEEKDTEKEKTVPVAAAKDDDDEKFEFIPFEHLNEWTGSPWNGPNFTYDGKKTVEDNNTFFESCYDQAIEFIVALFLKQNKDPNKTIQIHFTNAIDDKNMADVFEEIRLLIVKTNSVGHSRPLF